MKSAPRTIRLSTTSEAKIDRILKEHPYLNGNQTAAIELALAAYQSLASPKRTAGRPAKKETTK